MKELVALSKEQIMNPKEKAQELVDMMGMYTSTSFNHINGKYEPIYRNPYAKQCALLSVDEILNNIDFASMLTGADDYNYWLQVKQELKKL
jgi:hypothetical protein